MLSDNETAVDMQDEYRWLFSRPGGTVLELRDPVAAKETLGIVDSCIQTDSFPHIEMFLAWVGEIRFEWKGDELWHAASVGWVTKDTYAINYSPDPDQREDELWFYCPELTQKLVALAATESIRTWIWSNPELQHPDDLPDWYVEQKAREATENSDE